MVSFTLPTYNWQLGKNIYEKKILEDHLFKCSELLHGKATPKP